MPIFKVTVKVKLFWGVMMKIPTSFSGPGKIVNGQAVIALTAGGVGEQTIGGQFTLLKMVKQFH
jgi:hypothetical protein